MDGGIGQGKFNGLIIDRSKTQDEIDAQIDVSAEEFLKLESSWVRRMGINFSRRWGMFCRWVMQKQRNDPKETKRKEKPLEVELDSGGQFRMGSMLRSSLGNGNGSHLVVWASLNIKRM